VLVAAVLDEDEKVEKEGARRGDNGGTRRATHDVEHLPVAHPQHERTPHLGQTVARLEQEWQGQRKRAEHNGECAARGVAAARKEYRGVRASDGEREGGEDAQLEQQRQVRRHEVHLHAVAAEGERNRLGQLDVLLEQADERAHVRGGGRTQSEHSDGRG